MKKILYAFDIGNTNVSAGVFCNGKIVKRLKFPTKTSVRYDTCLKGLTVSKRFSKDVKAIISSVVPAATPRLERSIKRVMGLSSIVVGRDKKVPIKNLYHIKSQVGQDRLVDAFAAKVIYGSPAVVVDLGTAITFDVISRRGEYLGGLILPGIKMALESLYENTALLPRVEIGKAPSIIGRDTANSIRGGILFGFGSMCDELAERYKKMLGRDARVILTGGNAKLMKRYTKSISCIDEDITLKGLYLISGGVI